MCSFIPAAKDFLRSSSNAFAVIAIDHVATETTGLTAESPRGGITAQQHSAGELHIQHEFLFAAVHVTTEIHTQRGNQTENAALHQQCDMDRLAVEHGQTSFRENISENRQESTWKVSLFYELARGLSMGWQH